MEKLYSIFTDKEGNLDVSVVLGIIAFFAFVYFGYHQYIILAKDFDPQSFGLGAGGLAAGHGAAKLMGNKGDYGQ
jgi:hypothetical protein